MLLVRELEEGNNIEGTRLARATISRIHFFIVEARMQPVVALSAIGTIEIAAVSDVKAALQRFAVTQTLSRFQDVVAGKFATDFIEKLHGC